MPYQQVKHYKAVWNNAIFIGDGSLKTTLGFQQNRRQEFENVLDPNQYGLYFLLNTVNYDIHYMLILRSIGRPPMFGNNLAVANHHQTMHIVPLFLNLLEKPGDSCRRNALLFGSGPLQTIVVYRWR